MPLPQTVRFEGLKNPARDNLPGGKCYYTRLGFRPPRKGEFYLSGAVVMAYRAPNDLASAYHVVQPTHWAVTGQQRGAVVSL